MVERMVNYKISKYILNLLFLFLMTSCYANYSLTPVSNSNSNSSGATTTTNCPSNFIQIPSLITDGLGYNLCVAKYEMKVMQNDGTLINDGRGTAPLDVTLYKAQSRASGTPWSRLTYAQVIAECQELGAGYRLITNKEWNLIARNIEGVSQNWSNGILASGNSDGAIDSNALADGWTFTNSLNLLAAGNDSNGYEGTGNSSGQAFGVGGEQRRTLYLSNGEIIWDLAGNAREKIDVDGQGGTLSYTAGTNSFIDLNSAQMTTLISSMTSTHSYVFSALDFLPTGGSLNHASNNVGQFYSLSGVQSSMIIGRGGNYASGNSPGVFAGDIDESSSGTSSTAGFRCVFQY